MNETEAQEVLEKQAEAQEVVNKLVYLQQEKETLSKLKEFDTYIKSKEFGKAQRIVDNFDFGKKLSPGKISKLRSEVISAKNDILRETLPKDFSQLYLKCEDCGKFIPVDKKECIQDFTKTMFIGYCKKCNKRAIWWQETRRWFARSNPIEKFMKNRKFIV